MRLEVREGASSASGVRSQILALFLKMLKDAGGSPQEVSARHGITIDCSDSAELHLPLGHFRTLCDAIALELRDPLMGIHLAQRLTRGTYGLMEFLFRASSTPRQAVDHLIRYAPLINNLLEFSLVEQNGQAFVEFRVGNDPLGLGRQANEFSIAIFLKIGREIAGQTWDPRRAWFAHPEPPEADQIANALGADRIDFGCGASGLQFDAFLLDRSVPSSDDALHAFLERQASALAEELSVKDELKPVRENLRLLLRQGEPSVETLAATMNLTPRTLQRRLARHGTTFRAMVDEIRDALARLYLDHDRPISEVAYLLGYSDVRAFIRAHKRWTGKTPTARRQA
jgi:AraC-like DNA-binding protein